MRLVFITTKGFYCNSIGALMTERIDLNLYSVSGKTDSFSIIWK